MRYGSDDIIDWLADGKIEHVALNPGASLRGLHDSLVRAESPTPIITLHEEVAVGIAHGYAKAAGKPMGVFLHDLVGLQHASMALFNAWIDRVPMIVLGGSGPRAEEVRRPWLDWIHTGLPQGALVRDFVKWDTEPFTLEGLRDSLQRGLRTAMMGPQGPVYISVDAGIQEAPTETSFASLPEIEVHDLTVPVPMVEEVAEQLRTAQRPVVVVDRPVAGLGAALVELVETLPIAVIDLGGGCNFPTTHWADQSAVRDEVLGEADFVLTFEVRDVGWATMDTDTGTRRTTSRLPVGTPIVAIGLSELRHRGFLVPESLVSHARYLISEASSMVNALAENVARHGRNDNADARQEELARRHLASREAAHAQARRVASQSPVHPAYLATALWEAIHDGPWQLANGLLGGWPRRLWDINEAGQYLGRSGGEGLGYGLPASVGAALANRDTDVLVVDIQADGDLMYTPSALWTAAHHQLPLLIVMHNNRTYGKDELHQSEMASIRGRSDDVVPIGIHIDQPFVDFATLARSQGVEAFGPIDDPAETARVLKQAAHTVRTKRRPILVDIICSSD